MKTAELTELIRREPFRPFTIRLNNGADYEVRSREMIGGNKRLLYWFEQTKPYRHVRIDYDAVTEIIE